MSQNEPIQFVTCEGRLVWGHPTQPQPLKDEAGNIRKNDNGEEMRQFAFGVAFSKPDFTAHLAPHWQAAIEGAYPKGNFQQTKGSVPQTRGSVPSTFAKKIVDGDALDPDGKPYSERDGYAGCVVVTFASQLPQPPKVVTKSDDGVYSETDSIKCGDFVAVAASLVAHKGKPGVKSSKPGLYVNPHAVLLTREGEEIVKRGGIDLGGAFSAFGPSQTSKKNEPLDMLTGSRNTSTETSSRIEPAHDLVDALVGDNSQKDQSADDPLAGLF